jgi:hypothetical protein
MHTPQQGYDITAPIISSRSTIDGDGPAELVDGDSSSTAPDSTGEGAETGAPTVIAAIPAYGEADSIGDVIRAAAEHVTTVLVVDDGSDDDTAERARQAGAIVVRHGSNRGYGAAIQTAFEIAYERQGDHLVTLDADGQHDPEDIPKLVRAQREEDASVVIGNRFADDADSAVPMYRRIGLGIINAMTNLSMSRIHPSGWVGDTQSGFRAYDSAMIEAVAEADSIGDGMSASTDILDLAQQSGYAIADVGSEITYDVENSSQSNPVIHGGSVVANVLRTVERRRPITTLGVPGFAAVVVGFAVLYWSVWSATVTAVFPWGIALLSTVFVSLGALACLTAVVIHSLNQHELYRRRS